MKKIDKLTPCFNDVVESFGEDKYYAFASYIKDGEYRNLCVNRESLEDAAEQIWRDLCDIDWYEICPCITFYADGVAFEYKNIIGIFHYIFDHGRISFIDALWDDLKHDLIEMFKHYDSNYFNCWTIEEAVDEMIALWQTGSSEYMPWDVCDNLEIINQELYDIVSTPKD